MGALKKGWLLPDLLSVLWGADPGLLGCGLRRPGHCQGKYTVGSQEPGGPHSCSGYLYPRPLGDLGQII